MASSTPPPSSPVIVKRAAVTYGRRKDVLPETDSEATLVSSSSVTRDVSLGNNETSIGEEVSYSSDAFQPPESSSVTRIRDDDEDAENSFTSAAMRDKIVYVDEADSDSDDIVVSSTRSVEGTEAASPPPRKKRTAGMKSPRSPTPSEDGDAPKHRWSWKDKLKEIDQESDDDVPMGSTAGPSSSKAPGLNADPPMSVSPKITQPTEADGFGGSLSTLTGSSQPAIVSPSPSPVVGGAKRKKRPLIVDSDDDDALEQSSSQSPAKILFPITTPGSRSPFSPTPPTSDLDASGAKISQLKGKGKAGDVPPLRFNQDPELSHEKKSSSKRKDKDSRSKVKAPTKKELQATKFDQERIIADRHVQIERAGGKYSMSTFFQNLQNSKNTKLPIPKAPSSDPIQPFTSSPMVDSAAEANLEFGAPSTLLKKEILRPMPLRRVTEPVPPTHKPSGGEDLPDLSDDEEMPDMADLLAENERERKARELAEYKLRLVAEQQARAHVNDQASDDDLVIESSMHVVADEEAKERNVEKAKHIRPSEGRKRQLMLGGIGSSKIGKHRKDAHSPANKIRWDKLAESAKSEFAAKSGKYGKEEVSRLSKADLDRIMFEKATMVGAEQDRLKREEWESRRGKSAQSGVGMEVKAFTLDEIARRGQENAAKTARMDDMDEDSEEEAEDADWVPEERGSVTPEPRELGSGEEDEEEQRAGSEAEVAEEVQTDNEETEEETEGKENFRRPKRPRRSAPQRAVLDSDEDDDTENVNPLQKQPSIGRILVPDTSFIEENVAPRMPPMPHRGSLSSFDSPTEDENDKENNTQLMFDKSDDKENKAVVRHSPKTGRHASSLFGLEDGMRRTLSMSPSAVNFSADDESDKPRRAFKSLREDEDDPFAFSPSVTSFNARLQRRSPSSGSLKSPPPLFAQTQRPLEFSQSFEDGEDEHSAAIAKSGLQPGFSDLFKSGSVAPFKPSTGGGFSQWSEEQDSGLDKLRQAGDKDEFSLTLDVGLQPALDVDENIRRQADAIFEKEQEYVVEAANRKPRKEPTVYVNDDGFLTQTRPNVANPEIYRMDSPALTQTASLGSLKELSTQSTQRRPLRTISVGDVLESPENTSLKRLRKRGFTPSIDEEADREHSPSPPKRQRNAFDLLGKKPQRPEEDGKKLEKSEYVHAEAEESDDDDTFGFGGHRNKDDGEEEDGDDLDKTLEGLVDDADMDDATMAEELVMEKVKEHQEVDDQALEKLHQDAIEGKLRHKRRAGGLNLDDDSDDEDGEDEQAKRIRRQMAKKRRIDGDNLEELGANKETMAFYKTYQDDLDDDNEEFAHMQDLAVDMLHLPGDDQDVEMAAEDEEEEEEPRRVVTTLELKRELQMASRNNEHVESIDVDDVDWVDQDDVDDSSMTVKVTSRRAVQPRQKPGQVDMDGDFVRPKSPENKDRGRMTKWASGEKNFRNMGTGRSTGGAAVTGHKKQVKSGAGSLRSLPGGKKESAAVIPRKPVRTPSMLSVVSDKSSRFAN